MRFRRRKDVKMVERVRVGLIGCGKIARTHAAALSSLGESDFVACADVDVDRARAMAEDFHIPRIFPDAEALLTSGEVEAAVVCTPHPSHTPLVVAAAEAGVHVLCEKPITTRLTDADRMIAAAERAGIKFGVIFQRRFWPAAQRMRRAIDAGQLGNLTLGECIAHLSRDRAYFAQDAWRGKWATEGGGVLMNQSPHTLDVICHLAGQPSLVAAWNRTIFHTIETEDTSAAMLEWPNQAIGTLLVSTAQAGDAERLEIAGTRGVLQITNGNLAFRESSTDLHDFLAVSGNPFGKLTLDAREVPLDSGGGDHAAIYANFIDAVERGAALVADGSEARMSLELANALVYSSATCQHVALPLDREAYAVLMDRLQGVP